MIRVVILDIDGVVTTGKLLVDESGKEYKTLDFRDIDAIFDMWRKQYVLGFITGEDTPMVDYFERRFPHHHFYRGCKDKWSKVQEIIKQNGVTAEEVCFIGDSLKDLEAIQHVGLGICPQNAHPKVKRTAKRVLEARGGDGAVQELVEYLEYLKNMEGAK